MWKTLYGWISDSFPIFGYHRSPYIAISAAGNALTFLLMAVYVHSAASAFAIATTQMIFNAFLQLMVGTFLVDIARRDVKQSAALQSVANTAKWTGTLISQVMALIIYARGAGDSLKPDPSVLTARQAIALTAVAPALMALSVPFLHESKRSNSDVASCCRQLCQGLRRRSCLNLSDKSVRFALVVLLLQVNLAVVGCQYLMQRANWEWALSITALVSIFIGCSMFGHAWCSRRSRSTEVTEEALATPLQTNAELLRWTRVATFSFFANAIPTSSVSVGLLQFSVFDMGSYQTLGLISSAASLCASFAFGCLFGRWRIKSAISGSILVAAVANLAPLPFVMMSMDESGNLSSHHTGTLWSPVGALAISASIVGNISSIFTVLPIDTLLTSTCGLEACDRSGTALAVFLSCYSFGATVGGLISAPILSAIGLEGTNWKSLPAWIVATACAKLLILLLLPLLPPQPSQPGASASQIDDQGTQSEGSQEGGLQQSLSLPLTSA